MTKLYEVFASIKSEREFNNFLADLCTPAEIRDMNDRWKIAELLYAGKMPQLEIAKKVGASITTVSRVARFLNNEKFGGYRTALARIHHA
ncbi:MAG: YerC/YecD family TrpR-related protein [Alphaproteobacteria bacterium]|nr:YerC/YecD family TrpR-related protein [Alphaproteobacteria bacterium]